MSNVVLAHLKCATCRGCSFAINLLGDMLVHAVATCALHLALGEGGVLQARTHDLAFYTLMQQNSTLAK